MKSGTVPAALEEGSVFRGVDLSRRDKVLALAGTLAALLMAGLDQTIVATAGPEIQRDLQIPAARYAWITTAYLVASTVMLPIYGKLSDVFGRKPILLTGVGLFLLGSLLCGIAPSTGFLIGARAVQGLGAASLFTTTLAVIADLFPPQERGKYMGLIGAVMGISSVVGPIAGGIITDLLGWHWVFFINLPVGAVAMWLIVTRMPAIGGRGGEPVRIDVAGAFWLIACLVPLLVALSLGRPEGGAGEGLAWGSWPILALLGASAAAFLAFVFVERRAADPILDVRLFRTNRTVGMAALTMFVLGATFLFTVVFLPLYLVNVVGVSATRAGLSLMPLSLAMVGTSVLAGQMASRVGGVKILLLAALSVLAVAFAIMGFTLGPDSTQAEVTLKMVLIGLGMGPTLPLYTLVVQNASRPEELGVVTAGSIFARALGQVIGLALFGTLFATTLALSVTASVDRILTTLPEGPRQVVAAAVPAVSGAGEGTSVGFDAAVVRDAIALSFEVGAGVASTARVAPPPSGAAPLVPAAPVPPSPAAGTITTAAERDAALAAVDEIQHAFATSLTAAISALYRIGTVLVLIGLVLTALIPLEPPPGRSPDRAGQGPRGRRLSRTTRIARSGASREISHDTTS
jgi:EmrB/QacA subfamily drug resistance transporter